MQVKEWACNLQEYNQACTVSFAIDYLAFKTRYTDSLVTACFIVIFEHSEVPSPSLLNPKVCARPLHSYHLLDVVTIVAKHSV